MSSQDFRTLFNNPAFSHWYKKELTANNPSDTSFIGIGRQAAKPFVQKSVGDFILSGEQLTEIFGSATAKKLLDNAKNNVTELFDVVSYRTVAGQEQLVFPDIKFSNANSEITRLITVIGSDIDKNKLVGSIASYFEKNPQDIGHIFGFTNTLLIRAKESARKSLMEEAQKKLKSAKNVGSPVGIQEAELYLKDTEKQLLALDEFIDSMVDVLEEYDIESSKIKGLDLSINAKYRKTATSWAFTWEASAEQQAVGAKLATILGTVKQTKVGGKGVRGLFASLFTKPKPDLVKNLLKNFVQEFVDKSISAPKGSKLALLEQKGSPAVVELIEDSIKEALGAPKKFNNSYTGNSKLPTTPLVRVSKKNSTKSTVSQLKAQKNKIKAVRAKIASQKTGLASIKTQLNTSSLPNLLNQINGLLQQQIRRNMGTGTSRNVLNYRSGRFAESVKVERLSESRQGMITAFYSYMKYPYATFSEGGRQQYPRSRDPKTLISKSIREVAQTMVTNQLRAVNV